MYACMRLWRFSCGLYCPVRMSAFLMELGTFSHKVVRNIASIFSRMDWGNCWDSPRHSYLKYWIIYFSSFTVHMTIFHFVKATCFFLGEGGGAIFVLRFPLVGFLFLLCMMLGDLMSWTSLISRWNTIYDVDTRVLNSIFFCRKFACKPS